MGASDSPSEHFRDTMEVGRGLCDSEAVRVLTEEGPARVRELVALGVRFDRDGDDLALGREAAHSHARIIHAGGDTTGAEIQRGLHAALRDASVDAREGHTVLRVMVEDGACSGLLAESGGEIIEYSAPVVLLAAGGGGRLFSHTTNPPTANGDGAALAYEAGAQLADMEFFQFHPTALRKDGAPSFLVSEAVRGEGAVLRNAAGERFMVARHLQAELAPRDVVAREIWAQMEADHADCVHLDLSGIPADRVRGRFPQIYATCLRLGIDITTDLVPVAPAAHYMIGGVRTDLDGATTVPGLFACGEVACAGVHGANRLASNSLLESVVFSRRAARAAAEYVAQRAPVAAGLAPRAGGGPAVPAMRELTVPSIPRGLPTVSASEIPGLLWREAGLVRTGAGLGNALARLGDGSSSRQHRAAHMLVQAALLREESRGAHFRADHPDLSEAWQGHVILQRDEPPRFDPA
jgi:L-aspartate oxidase